jgi:hypothetical protein
MTKSDLAMTPEQIAETASVSEALGNFTEDQSRENTVALVRAVMDAVKPMQEDEPKYGSYVTNCTVISRQESDKPLFVGSGSKVFCRLDRYTILPSEKYDELRRAAEELLEQIRLYSECKFGWHGIRNTSEKLRAALERTK